MGFGFLKKNVICLNGINGYKRGKDGLEKRKRSNGRHTGRIYSDEERSVRKRKEGGDEQSHSERGFNVWPTFSDVQVKVSIKINT